MDLGWGSCTSRSTKVFPLGFSLGLVHEVWLQKAIKKHRHMGDKRSTGVRLSMNSETTNSGNDPFLVDSVISVDGKTQYNSSSPR